MIDAAAVLFDCDGVLVDSAASVERAWRRWAAERGLDADAIVAVAHGRRTEDTMRELGLAGDLAAEVQRLEGYEIADAPSVSAYPAAAALLPELAPGSWAVVTSGTRALATSRLEAAGLPLPAVLVTADDVAAGKPDPEGYLEAARRLGLTPAECLVLEDAPAGVQAALAAGMRVVGLPTTHPAEELAAATLVATWDELVLRGAGGRVVLSRGDAYDRALMASASILTIGNEIVSGDVPNTNAVWLARRLAPLGVAVRMIAALPDEIEAIAELVRSEAPRVDFLFVTGGLGGTPDDLTREALAHAFGVAQEEIPDLAADLRARFLRDPEYAARWALLPRGSRALPNPLGGAPGFALENVYVMPGLPAEMEAMFAAVEEEFRRGSPIGAWRRTYRTRESVIAPLLAECGERWPGVLVGSYPTFLPDGPRVEVVVKSADADELAAASAWLEASLAAIIVS